MTKIGLDLGTTNTVVAADGEALQVADPNERAENGPFLPSVVAFLPNGEKLVGSPARRRRAIDPKNTIYSAKRLIGRSWGSGDAAKFASRYPFDLVEGASGEVLFKTRAGEFSATDIGKLVIERRFELSQIPLAGSTLTMSVPTKFGERETAATVAAAEAAGADRAVAIKEPVATAWAYMSVHDEPLGTAAVYDLGGGTFDFAIVECGAKTVEVLGHGGDLYLGGDDIDRALAEWVADEVLRDHHWDLRDDASVYARLLLECEQAKVRASYTGRAAVSLTQVDAGAPVGTDQVIVEQATVGKLAAELVQKTFVICDQVLHQVGKKPKDIKQILLAGGTAQSAFVRDAVAAYFGQEPRYDFDPMEVISIGASLVPLP